MFKMRYGYTWNYLKGTMLGLGISGFGLAVGIIVIMSAAALTSMPVLFLSSGAMAYGIVCFVGVRFAYRRAKRPELLRSASALSVIMFLSAAFVFLKPLDDPHNEPNPIDGLGYWELPTGSLIAYVHIEGKGAGQPYPIVFLHGGPGTPDMAGDLRYFGRLAELGYDFYIYDQSGSGRSTRLQDPRGYTLSRDVAELEAIRRRIGAERMILVGHSYGCEIIANYMVSYENHVAKAVLSSPGAINPSDRSDAQITSRLDAAQRRKLYGKLIHPRVLLTYALLQINPRAAHSFAGDKEMDARFDLVYAATEPALHAKGKRYEHPVYGLGFYAHQTPQSRTAPRKRDLRQVLEGNNVPVLIIKGSDDYLSWSSAMDYRKALKKSQLIFVEEAGHNAYQDQPDIVFDSIRSFLADRPLPLPTYQAEAPPASFRGPP